MNIVVSNGDTITVKTHSTPLHKQRGILKRFIGQRLYALLKQHKAIIAGGSIRSIFCKEDIHDIDVYFRDEESFRYVATAVKASTIVSITDKQISYLYNSWADASSGEPFVLQLINFKYYEEATDIFETFDFHCCMGAYDFEKEDFVLDDSFLLDNTSRTLTFNSGTAFPIVTLSRILKYKDYGYNISHREIIKIGLRVADMHIDNWDEFKKQIGGMYGDCFKVGDTEGKEFSIEAAVKMLEAVVNTPYTSVCEKLDSVDISLGKTFDAFLYKGRIRYLDNDFDLILKDDSSTVSLNVMTKDDFFNKHPLYKIIKKDMTSFFDDSFKYSFKDKVSGKEKVGLFFRINPINLPNKESDKAMLVRAKEFDIFSIGSSDILLNNVLVESV